MKDNELIAITSNDEAPVLVWGRLNAMRVFEKFGMELGPYSGGWTGLDALRGDPAVRRFVEGHASYVRTPAGLRADVVELPKENK